MAYETAKLGNYNRECIMEILRTYPLMLTNTVFDFGPTLFQATGGASRIDYDALPLAARGSVWHEDRWRRALPCIARAGGRS